MVTSALPLSEPEIDIQEFLDASGRSPFARWFEGLNAAAAARVYELKIDFGPGYRVYFGKDGERIVILLGGGSKKRQDAAITAAQAALAEYKRRKGGKE